MEGLKDVAHIAGRPGLFKIIKPGRAGVIVESMDSIGKKEIVNANAKVSVLKDISIYSEDYDKSTPLSEIFQTIRNLKGNSVEFDHKNADPKSYFSFFAEIMPDFDTERVYSSDIKKIIQWYNLLSAQMPELFTPAEIVEDTKEEPAKEAKKPAAKKTKAAK